MSAQFVLSAIAIAMALSQLIKPVRRWLNHHSLRLIARIAPESWLYKFSLWNECDGEPLNEWADEMVRRDGLPAEEGGKL